MTVVYPVWTWIGLKTTEEERKCFISINYTFTTCIVTVCGLVGISQVWAGVSTVAFCCLVFSSNVRAVIAIQTWRRICARTVPCTVSNPTSYRTLGPSTPVRVATVCSQNWESIQQENQHDMLSSQLNFESSELIWLNMLRCYVTMFCLLSYQGFRSLLSTRNKEDS